MRISDWSSDVCSSDLLDVAAERRADLKRRPTLYKLRAKVEITESDWQGFVLFGSETPPELPKLLPDAAAVLSADPTRRAYCRGRVLRYVEISGVGGTLHKKT